MGASFLVLALAGYLGFLVDWKEFGGIMRQGGWAAVCIYLVVSALIVASMVAHAAVNTGVIH